MYYLICTIIIMVFCITALTGKSMPESEIFIPLPKPHQPKTERDVANQAINCTNKSQSDMQVLDTTDSMAHVKYIKRIYNYHEPGAGSDQQISWPVLNIPRSRKGAISVTGDRLVVTHTTPANQIEHVITPVYSFTVLVPATSFFVMKNKTEPFRRITTSPDVSNSIGQLRYFMVQAPLNNGLIYRKVLKLKYNRENASALNPNIPNREF